MTQSPLQPTVGELLATMTTQVSTLIKDEIELVKTQLAEKGKLLGVGVGLFVGAALFGFLALLVLITTAILALALVLPAWAAALIIAVVLLLVAGALAFIGKKQLDAGNQINPDIGANVKQDIEVVKEGLQS